MTEDKATDTFHASRRDALKTLDWEISLIQDDQKRSGMTSWTIALGLAAILWAIVREEGISWDGLPRLAYLTVGFSLVQQLYANVASVLSRSAVAGERTRVTTPWHRWAGQRLSIVYAAVNLLVLLWLLKIQNIAGVWTASLVALLLIVGLLIFVMGFATSYIRAKIKTKEQSPSRLSRAITNAGRAFLLFLLVVSALYWMPFFRFHLSFAPLEYRLAGLFTAAMFVAGMFVARQNQQPLLDSLIRLRRDLAFGHVSVDAATMELEFLTGGLSEERASDVEREDRLHAEREMKAKIEAVLASVRAEGATLAVATSTEEIEDAHKRLTAGRKGWYETRRLWLLPKGYSSSKWSIIRLLMDEESSKVLSRSQALVSVGSAVKELEDEMIRVERDAVAAAYARIHQAAAPPVKTE